MWKLHLFSLQFQQNMLDDCVGWTGNITDRKGGCDGGSEALNGMMHISTAICDANFGHFHLKRRTHHACTASCILSCQSITHLFGACILSCRTRSIMHLFGAGSSDRGLTWTQCKDGSCNMPLPRSPTKCLGARLQHLIDHTTTHFVDGLMMVVLTMEIN
jgi:hypothetical protein